MKEQNLNQFLTENPNAQLNYYGLTIGNTYNPDLYDDEEAETIGRDLSCVYKDVTLRRFDDDQDWKLVSSVYEVSLNNAVKAFELLREYLSKDVVEEDEVKVVQ